MRAISSGLNPPGRPQERETPMPRRSGALVFSKLNSRAR